MGRPLTLVGKQAKVVSFFALLDVEAGITKQALYQFEKSPPKNDKEWEWFYRQVIHLIRLEDNKQHLARQGLEVAQDNGIISQTTDPVAAIEETIAWLQGKLEELKASEQ